MAYALGISWGPMGDRFGPRRVVAAGLFASVIAALLMGASNSSFSAFQPVVRHPRVVPVVRLGAADQKCR